MGKKIGKDFKKQMEDMQKDNKVWTKLFIKQSMERGKTISIILPLVKEEDIIDLLSELWDLRVSKKDYETRLLNQKK